MLVLNIYTIVLTLFLSFFLYFKSDNNLLNKLLALIFVFPGFTFGLNLIQLSGVVVPNHQIYLYLAFIPSYLFAPAVYCYIELLCGEKIKWKFPLFHITLLLIIAVVFFSIESLFLAEKEKQQLINELKSGTFPLKIMILNYVFFTTQLVYFTISTFKVVRFKSSLKSSLTETQKTRVRYADIFIKLIWMLNGILLLTYCVLSVEGAEYIASPILFMIFFGFVSYFGMKYNVIFHFNEINPFYRKTYHADEEEKKYFCELIINHLEKSKAYLNPDYNLSDLAKDLNSSPAKVSQAINQELNKNFSDLINSYRIETAKQILVTESHLSVEGVALNAGFSSRATFYRAFKKQTGVSPIEYMNSIE